MEFSQFLDPDKDSSQPYGNLVLNPEFAESLSVSDKISQTPES